MELSATFLRVMFLWILCFAWVGARPVLARATAKARSGRFVCVDPATGLSGSFTFEQYVRFSQQYLRLHNVSNAIPCLERAHALRETEFSTAYDLMLAYIQEGQMDAARTLAERQLQLQDRAEFHDLLGTIDSRQGRFRAASEQYQIATQEEPSEQNIFDFGSSLSKFEGDSAERIFRFGVAKYPNSVKLHVGLGSALYGHGRSSEGAKEMYQAAMLDPTDPHPMEMIGAAEQIPSSMAQEATARFAALVRLYPQNALLLYYYAMALSGRWSGDSSPVNPQTIELLKQSVLLDPHLAKPYFQLAEMEEQLEHYDEAVRYYERAARLDPANEQYLYRLAFAYKRTGNKSGFMKEIDRFQALHDRTGQPH